MVMRDGEGGTYSPVTTTCSILRARISGARVVTACEVRGQIMSCANEAKVVRRTLVVLVLWFQRSSVSIMEAKVVPRKMKNAREHDAHQRTQNTSPHAGSAPCGSA